MDKPWEFGDIIFIVEGRKIYANKGVLVISSDVFKLMFTSDFAEKKMTEIRLPDKKFADFLQLMQILHPQMLKRLDKTNVYGILPLAHEYQMKGVLKQCVRTLADGHPSIRSLIMVDKYNLKLPQLRKRCMKYMKDTALKTLKAERGFKDLKPETLIDVLNSKVERFETLQTQVDKVTSWVGSDDPEWCPRYMDHYRGTKSKCSVCKEYNCTSGENHERGTDSDCSVCKAYRFDMISEVQLADKRRLKATDLDYDSSSESESSSASDSDDDSE